MNFLTINEHGELFENENAITDSEVAQTLLRNVRLTSNFNLETTFEKTKYLIEAFDHPLVGHKLVAQGEKVFIETQQQQLTFECDLKKFSLDPFDRICGLTTTQAPFRLTEKAQAQLFDTCDKFDDDSFTLNGIKVDTPEYYFENQNLSDSQFWTDIYNEGNPGWDLGEPAAAFKDMIQRIKLPKCRVLVLGCGAGHDAALFAQAGHVVTAVDFSKGAIDQANKLYGHMENLSFIQQDIFTLPHEWNGTFDVIIEHTCFCAIDPHRRKEMVKLWRRLLHEEGQLIAVFFAMLKRAGPPYGSSEWEIRELLKDSFQFLFWGRWRKSIPRREGRELFVLGKKRV